MDSVRNNHHCGCESGHPGLTWNDTHKILTHLNENHSAVLTRQIPRFCSELRSQGFTVSPPDRLMQPLAENAYGNGRRIFDEILSSGGHNATCQRLAQVFINIGEISAAEYICQAAPEVAAPAVAVPQVAPPAENPKQGRKRNPNTCSALKVAGVALGVLLIPLLVCGAIWLSLRPDPAAGLVPGDPPSPATTTSLPRSPHPTQEPRHIPKNSTKFPLISPKIGPGARDRLDSLVSVNISNARMLHFRNCHKSYNFTYNLRLGPEWDSASEHIRRCTGRADIWDVVTVTGIGTVRAFTNIVQSSSPTVGSLRVQKLTLQQEPDLQTCAGSLAPITFPTLTDLEFRNLTVSTATCAAQALAHSEFPALERISITDQDLTVHSVEAYRKLITKAMESSGTFKVLELRGVRSDDDPDRLALLTDEMCSRFRPDFKIDIGSWAWSLTPDYQLVVRNIWAHPTCRRRFLPNLT